MRRINICYLMRTYLKKYDNLYCIIKIDKNGYSLFNTEDGNIEVHRCISPEEYLKFAKSCKSYEFSKKDFNKLSDKEKRWLESLHEEMLKFVELRISEIFKLSSNTYNIKHDKESFDELLEMVKYRKYKTIEEQYKIMELATKALTINGVPSYTQIYRFLQLTDRFVSIHDSGKDYESKFRLTINKRTINFGTDIKHP